MKRLIAALILGTTIPVLVAALLYYDDENQRAQLIPIMVRIHHAEVQPVKNTAKQLKLLSVHYSYTASGHSYEWNGLLPLSSLQYEEAYSLVKTAQNEKYVEAWVRKETPDKLVLFLPKDRLSIPVYFFLVCLGFVVILITMLAGPGLTRRSTGRALRRAG